MKQILNRTNLQQIKFNSTYSRIKDLSEKHIGEQINIKGWIKGIRNMKEYLFVDINDGSCLKNLQVLVPKDQKSNFNFGASSDFTGTLAKSPRGQLELKADKTNVLGKCPLTDGFPFTPKQSYPPEYIRDHLHLRSRVSTFNSMMRTRHHATKAFNDYFNKLNFTQVHTPILTANDCEGAGEVFSVKAENQAVLKNMVKTNVSLENAYFDKKTYLTVSGQLHLEAMAHGLGNVYTFGPTFRAENSKSPVHLSEFYMLEAEECFVESILNTTTIIEDMIKVVTKQVLDNCEEDILNVQGKKIFDCSWIDKKFPIIEFKTAVEILKENQEKLTKPVNHKDGLSKEHELFLVKHFNSPVFVIDWPAQMKPFYMRKKGENSEIAEALDFLVPFVGELAGGSVREDSYEKLVDSVPADLRWYAELRKFGGITTGGFGLGFERYLQFLLHVNNIKDVIPYPRWAHNCSL